MAAEASYYFGSESLEHAVAIDAQPLLALSPVALSILYCATTNFCAHKNELKFVDLKNSAKKIGSPTHQNLIEIICSDLTFTSKNLPLTTSDF